jgi:hypothetical protein
MSKNVLYIHGMGGNGHDGFFNSLVDQLGYKVSNIGQIYFNTFDYDFDPEKAQEQVSKAINSFFHPDLIIATSLGAFHAQMFPNIPRILISPALNAGKVIAQIGEELEKDPFKRLMIETSLSNTKGCQTLTTNPKILKKFQALADKIDQNIESLKNCPAYAVYGGNDMYMQMNVVNPKHFEAIFNSVNYDIIPSYDHNFSGFDVIDFIVPKIYEFLGIDEHDFIIDTRTDIFSHSS